MVLTTFEMDISNWLGVVDVFYVSFLNWAQTVIILMSYKLIAIFIMLNRPPWLILLMLEPCNLHWSRTMLVLRRVIDFLFCISLIYSNY
jgi:hypothetical protein